MIINRGRWIILRTPRPPCLRSVFPSAEPVYNNPTFPYHQLTCVNRRMCSCCKAGESSKGGKNPEITGEKPPTRRISTCDTDSVGSRKPLSTSSVSVQTSPRKMPGETAVLRFAKLSDKAFAPTKGSDLAAGLDLKSAYDYVIPARGKELVKTDIQVAIPEGCYGRVAPRSGLAWKHHIDVGAGVVDADYTGNVGVVMFNHGPTDFHVKAGDRVAQLICERLVYPDVQEVQVIDPTARGEGGFGSTGSR